MESPTALQPGDEPCLVCYDEITGSNFAAYQLVENGVWYPAKFCIECIKYLLDSMFDRYVNSLLNSTCAKELKALLDAGPPINIREKHAFPEADIEEIHQLWDFGNNTAMSAKLKNSLTGEERLNFWSEKRATLLISIDSDDEEESS